MNKNHFVFFDHEVGDFASIETHNGGDATAVFGGEDRFWGSSEDVDELLESFWGIFRNRLRRFLGAIFFELWVNKFYKFSH